MNATCVNELVELNRARIKEGKGSPKILIGSINLAGPNFHTLPLIEMGASFVSISVDERDRGQIDRLYCDPCASMVEAMKELPPHWRPDFFFDSQAEHGHYFPVGLGEIQIPTIASYVHSHLGQCLLHMEEMFDCLVKPSECMKWGDAYLPWGASWGAMTERIGMFNLPPAPKDRPITVSCTIGTSGIGRESARFAVIKEMQRIQAARPDWDIVVSGGFKQADYFDLLARSRVAINVGAWGSTMTYRPFEVIAQGAALLHVDETAYGSTSKLSEFFEPWWYTTEPPEHLERGIERALQMLPTRLKGAGQVRAHLIAQEVEKQYSYRKQYERLFDLAASVKIKKKPNLIDWSRRAYAVCSLVGFQDFAEPHSWALTPEDEAKQPIIRDGVCLWSPKDPEQRYRWQTTLARREAPPQAVYDLYAS